ncbi:alanine racemase [Cohnella soli]|uniref:Alanine racemase n=1 Tax=Cohnella soli TaxID=425005 RepID=A0ABW0I3N6_9BACL
MVTASYRDTQAEVSLEAIRHNVRTIRSGLGERCRMMAVVKADGYGHGAVEVARAALEAGASDLGVAFLDEAIALIDAGIRAPILLLGHISSRAVEEAIRREVAMTVFAEETMDAIIAGCRKLNRRARVHLKIDTGMTRLGVASADEAYSLASQALDSGCIELEGIFTHFANADNEDEVYTRMQLSRFVDMIADLEKRGIRFPVKHCCNSAATLKFPDMHMDMVRVGIALYGLSPFSQERCTPLPLIPAMELKTRIVALRSVPQGTSVSYGRRYTTEEDSLIATLPIGYADGYSRQLSNNGTVLVHGSAAPVVGTVCMDQIMIDVTGIPGVRVGDEVVLFGASEGGAVSIDAVAGNLRSINYEVVCKVGKRVPRIYVENGFRC